MNGFLLWNFIHFTLQKCFPSRLKKISFKQGSLDWHTSKLSHLNIPGKLSSILRMKSYKRKYTETLALFALNLSHWATLDGPPSGVFEILKCPSWNSICLHLLSKLGQYQVFIGKTEGSSEEHSSGPGMVMMIWNEVVGTPLGKTKNRHSSTGSVERE